MLTRRQTLASLLSPALAPLARGAAYPERAVTLLIAYPPGGPADLIARTTADALNERLGQPVVVNSKPGAGGQLAGKAALRAPADGHTLLLGDIATLATNRFLFSDFAYDPVTDFDAVAPLLVMPMALFVPMASPYESFRSLVAASLAKPLNFGSQGPGSTGHLLGELLRQATGGQFEHVPYKGSAPAMTDLIGGHIDLLFDGVGPGLPHVTGKRLRALTLAGPSRLEPLPNVPTTAEEGFASVAMSVWFGLVARARTPASCVQVLHAEVTLAMREPDPRKRFDDLGFLPLAMSSSQFSAFIRDESQKWGAFIRRSGIVVT